MTPQQQAVAATVALLPHTGLTYLDIYRRMTPRQVSDIYEGVAAALKQDDKPFTGPMEM